MVIQPGDTTTLDDLYMILSFFRWTAFSTDAYELFSGHLDVTCCCCSSFHKIASLDTAHGPATVTVPLKSTLKDQYRLANINASSGQARESTANS
jgi:hypothetical protein